MDSALHKGRQWKRLVRIEKAALLTIKGYPNDVIAMHIGIHPQTLVYLRTTPEFKARIIALQTGVIEQHNAQVFEDEEYQRAELKHMVPVALQKLKDLAMSANQNIAFKASQDILDREGTHAKVSRTAIDVKEQINFSVINQVAASIQDVLKSAPKSEALTATLDSEAPSGAADDIMSEFTKGATDSTSQLYQMEEAINKDSVEDLSAKPEKRLKIN